MRSKIYSVSGTHCHACEILIEKEIKNLPGVKSVEASTVSSSVTIIGKNIPDISKLNKIFKESGYVFSPALSREGARRAEGFKPNIFISIFISFLVLCLFYVLNSSGIIPNVQVNNSSSLFLFFAFGLVAGLSTCAALVGSIMLTISRRGMLAITFFSLGRVMLFALFGALLGLVGSYFRLSVTAGSVITILVSVLMLVLGLQMLGAKYFSRFQISLPKSITGNIANEKNFSGKFAPFILGGLTFFLPCGFTLTAQSLALASGSSLTAAAIMGAFALGTFIPLLLIGYSSVVSSQNKNTSAYFSQVAGILVIVFALFNIKSQAVVLGFDFPSSYQLQVTSINSTVPIVNGIQIIKMDASATGYSPSTFTIKAGLPVRWEITDRGTVGCTNAVISRSLFAGQINLVPGTTSVKEFTAPTTTGTYRFSCWMGMISGTIEVVK
ncbi:MAG: sulfite exporter TauE/SafE family protein [Candidatus Shapirobacteria bacterium]